MEVLQARAAAPTERRRVIVPPLAAAELIGRTPELEALLHRQRMAARGHGGVALLSGDAGLGKTRLLRAFREGLTGGRAAVWGAARLVGKGASNKEIAAAFVAWRVT